LPLTLCGLPSLARAADLVVGVVHDTDGYAVAGASIALRQTGGAAAGAGKTDRDGTFAIDGRAAVATVEVRCAYCMPTTVKRGAADAPVIAVVRRYAALRDRAFRPPTRACCPTIRSPIWRRSFRSPSQRTARSAIAVWRRAAAR